MSAGRALVDCAVLSLQDTCVFYPCCQCCFSRIDVEQRDTLRCRCSRCGYSCVREQVEYRYRLSLRVARDKCIFGITVFGTCLNQYFGVPASALQRLVHSVDGPVGAATRSTLLVKAVEDCFIGRHFIFGIKVTGKESGLWLGGQHAHGSSNKSRVQFIASQMILPIPTGLEGCSVVSYYRALLQKAAECELGSTDSGKTTRAPATTLLLIPHHTPANNFSNTTLSASGLLSLQSSQCQDCSLAPTPPWQQSLGLVTSSAEQEEGSSTQDSADDNNTQTDNYKTSHDAQKSCLEKCKATEDRTLSPLFLEQRSYYSLSFDTHSYSSIEKTVNNRILNTWASPSQPGHKNDLPLSFKTNEFTSRQPTTTFLSSSLAWDDLPFSESLTDFLCEADKNFDGAAEPHLNVPGHKDTARKNLEIKSQTKTLSIESTCACQSSTKEAESHSRTLLDVINSSPPNNTGDTHDLSEQVCKNPVGYINRSQARTICSHEHNQNDEEVSSQPFENEAQQLEDNTYDCSADLFSSSLMMDMNEMLNTHAGFARVAAEACPPLSIADKKHQRSDGTNVPHSSSNKLKVRSYKCFNRDSLIPAVTLDLDFIPPSQSTPSVKLAVVSAKITPSLCKLNTVSAHQLSQCSIESTKENLLWNTKSNKYCHGFTKFLCKAEQDYDCVSERGVQINVQIQKGTAKKKLEIRSQDENLSTASNCLCQSSTQEAENHSRMLLDVTNSHAPNNRGDMHDLSAQVFKNPVGSTNRSQARTICSHECNQNDEVASSQCFNNEKEHLENNTYDCSADLFSSSLMVDMNTEILNTHAETSRLTAEANVQHSTPDNLKIKSKKCINRDSLIPPVTLDLDFIPPSQSTPIIKLAVVPAKITLSLCKLNTNQISQCGRESIKKNLVWSTTSSRHCHRLTPKRTFWKPKKHQRHLSVQRGAVSLGSAVRVKHKTNSSVCDFKDKDISPTFATETQLGVKLKRRYSDNSSGHLDSRQGGGVKCKRTLLHPTLTPSQTAVAQTGNCEMAVRGILDGSNGYFLDNENQTSDWSRDLFSDSF